MIRYSLIIPFLFCIFTLGYPASHAYGEEWLGLGGDDIRGISMVIEYDILPATPTLRQAANIRENHRSTQPTTQWGQVWIDLGSHRFKGKIFDTEKKPLPTQTPILEERIEEQSRTIINYPKQRIQTYEAIGTLPVVLQPALQIVFSGTFYEGDRIADIIDYASRENYIQDKNGFHTIDLKHPPTQRWQSQGYPVTIRCSKTWLPLEIHAPNSIHQLFEWGQDKTSGMPYLKRWEYQDGHTIYRSTVKEIQINPLFTKDWFDLPASPGFKTIDTRKLLKSPLDF